jgi:hypothetical protein
MTPLHHPKKMDASKVDKFVAVKMHIVSIAPS